MILYEFIAHLNQSIKNMINQCDDCRYPGKCKGLNMDLDIQILQKKQKQNHRELLHLLLIIDYEC